jgi:hypothetical protein
MKNLQKISNSFHCPNCDYNCSKNSEWQKHLSTQKHFRLTNTNLDEPKNLQFICDCGKKYKHMPSLCKHRKTCIFINNKYAINNGSINDTSLLTNLVLEVVKNNNELQKQCVELQKQNQEFQQKLFESFNELSKNNTITNNITNTNSHNKAFNLNVFLNETCKDAMNIMDFVDSIKLQLCDLEKVGKIGYVEGISNIIVKNLNSLDETKRPVHCTDAKREVMYIKDENKWEKENENKQKLRKAIKQIAHKNSKMLNEFKSKHPDCDKSDSMFSDQYNKLIIEAMGGKGDNDLEKEDKIIKNIAKEVVIEK